MKFNIKTYISALAKRFVNQEYSLSVSMVGVQTTMTRRIIWVRPLSVMTTLWYSSAYSNINKVEENETNKELLDSYRTYTEMVEKKQTPSPRIWMLDMKHLQMQKPTLWKKHICSHVTTTLAGV